MYLNHQNLEPVPANSGEEALTKARRQEFDAYLIDNQLPGLSGLELCRRIRKFDFDTPIVFYSGDDDQSHKEEAFFAGAQAYIVKPSSCEEVLEVLLAAVKGRVK